MCKWQQYATLLEKQLTIGEVDGEFELNVNVAKAANFLTMLLQNQN
jgi:hypothetical protein